MKQSGKCPKCGCTSIIPHAKIVTTAQGDQDLRVRVDAAPDAWIFKHAARSYLDAFVCSKCGYTELYTREPADLHDAHLKAKEDAGTQ